MDVNELGTLLKEYCAKYKIPELYIISILDDQKVLPMIRGKATEYNAFLLLLETLNSAEWSVEKLNLNAQSGIHDEDVSVTHKRTGVIIKVECKNATRGSMMYSARARIKVPHFKVKCHKSRSDISKAETTNDRYFDTDFDIILTNLSNAIIEGATFTESFVLINRPDVIAALVDHYALESPTFTELFNATYNDWRCAKSTSISQDHVIPRTPSVLLKDDPTWKPINRIEELLLEIVNERLRQRKSVSRR